MLTNIALREKIDKYVDEGLYDINCKQYHDEMLEALKSATAEEKEEGKRYLRERLSEKKIHQSNSLKDSEMSFKQNNDEVCCPSCGSTQIVANKKGFGLVKAAAGGLLLRTSWITWWGFRK